MKKSILASSIAAAVFGLGAVGAHALTVQPGGVGDVLIVPYFSTQADNATLLNITNTDLKSGKAVKVRFRGAANSDDVFDFQVFLSPGDVWTANISKGADGLSRLTTSDKSCTKPSAAVLNATPFITSRLDQRLTGDALAAGTREGYIEIIGMADIPKDSTVTTGRAQDWAPDAGNTTAPQTSGLAMTTFPPVTAADRINPLWTAIKHVNGVAPCAGTAFTALDSTDAFNLTNTKAALSWVPAGTAGGPAAQYGMTPSTGGLMADWSIVNVVNAAAWGGQAVALTATSTDRSLALTDMNVVYSPQIGVGTGTAIAKEWSADPLFLKADANTLVYNMTSQNYVAPAGVAPVFASGYYDLPDLSTSLVGAKGAVANALQVQKTTDALALRTGIINEYATESEINGATDWVFSMPTRRYSVAMAYSKISATNDGRVWNRFLNNHVAVVADLVAVPAVEAIPVVSNQFRLSNTSIVGNLICVNGARPVAYDREEGTKTSAAEVVVSPSTVAGGVKLCGETSVLAFNNGAASGAVKAAVAVTGVDVGYSAGWATMSVASGAATSVNGAVASVNYPITGGAFQRAAFGAQGFGIYRPFR